MAFTLYWASGSPFAWRVLLALEHKRLPYESQLLHFDKQEQQSPQMLKLNPRGRVPVLKDGDFVVFESVAVLYYLDVKYPQAPIFGATPEEAGVIMRVICEFMTYAEPSLLKIVNAIFAGAVAEDIDALTDAMHIVAREARTIEGRLSKEQWIVGANYSATDMVIFPWIQVLRRALNRAGAAELGARFLPMERNYPALARWIHRVEALPGYEHSYPTLVSAVGAVMFIGPSIRQGEFALREFNAGSKKIYENLRILCRQVGWQRPPGGRQPGDRTNMRGDTKMRTGL